MKSSLAIWPAANLTFFSVWGKNIEQKTYRLFLDAARKAGAPEWPYGFVGDEAYRIRGKELEETCVG